jgi:hypothetical protein
MHAPDRVVRRHYRATDPWRGYTIDIRESEFSEGTAQSDVFIPGRSTPPIPSAAGDVLFNDVGPSLGGASLARPLSCQPFDPFSPAWISPPQRRGELFS